MGTRDEADTGGQAGAPPRWRRIARPWPPARSRPPRIETGRRLWQALPAVRDVEDRASHDWDPTAAHDGAGLPLPVR